MAESNKELDAELADLHIIIETRDGSHRCLCGWLYDQQAGFWLAMVAALEHYEEQADRRARNG